MNQTFRLVSGIAALSLLIATPALAHEGHAQASIAAGLLHPFTGLDHVLAMLAVGWVAFSRGKAFLALPAAFMGFMVLGGTLGLNGVAVSSVEAGIAVSVLVLGLTLAATKQIPLIPSILLTGVFAMFHGQAHAAEMATGGTAALYIAGFVVGTGMLHLLGFALSACAEKVMDPRPLNTIVGMSTAGIGATMLMGAL